MLQRVDEIQEAYKIVLKDLKEKRDILDLKIKAIEHYQECKNVPRSLDMMGGGE